MNDRPARHRIVSCIPERREPGTMFFNVRPGGSEDQAGEYGWVLSRTFSAILQRVWDVPKGDMTFPTLRPLVSWSD